MITPSPQRGPEGGDETEEDGGGDDDGGELEDRSMMTDHDHDDDRDELERGDDDKDDADDEYVSHHDGSSTHVPLPQIHPSSKIHGGTGQLLRLHRSKNGSKLHSSHTSQSGGGDDDGSEPGNGSEMIDHDHDHDDDDGTETLDDDGGELEDGSMMTDHDHDDDEEDGTGIVLLDDGAGHETGSGTQRPSGHFQLFSKVHPNPQAASD